MNKLSLRTLVKNRKKKGFTLVELIIVIAIIAILAAIAIPKFGQITRNANIKADIATAKNIHGITAQLIADGTITAPVTKGAQDTVIAGKIDGAGSTMPNTKLDKTKAFTVQVESDGDVIIYAGDGKEIYPNSTAYDTAS